METSIDVGSDGSSQSPVVIDPLAWYLDTIVHQLEAGGVSHAVVCPGSRSTPLTLALHRSLNIEINVLIDERSAGYFALGLARALHAPVALVVTSGTAAANLLPAVVEASLSQVPLIVMTADRPRELRGVGASQTIDQVELYGSHAKYFIDLPTPEPLLEVMRYVRTQVARALQIAGDQPPGPVHLNFPLREPLLPDWTHSAPAPTSVPIWHPQLVAMPQAVTRAKELLGQHPHGIVVAGSGIGDAVKAKLVDWANAWGWPILADPLSNMRHYGGPVIGSYDLMLRSGAVLSPQAVLRVGSIPTSKSLNQLLRGLPGVILETQPQGLDPNSQDLLILGGDLELSLTALAEPAPNYRVDPQWLTRWRTTHDAIVRHLAFALDALAPNAEPHLFAHLDTWIGADSEHKLAVMVSNSMPIRDLDTYLIQGAARLQFFANRGANGIDGVTSTALGLSAHYGDVVLIIGDLAFYHDMNGLLAAAKLGLNALIVVVNNQGGGIFSFLPQREHLTREVFESYYGTPLNLDFSHVASLYGGVFRRVANGQALLESLRDFRKTKGLRIVEWVVANRDDNRLAHQTSIQAIADGLTDE